MTKLIGMRDDRSAETSWAFLWKTVREPGFWKVMSPFWRPPSRIRTSQVVRLYMAWRNAETGRGWDLEFGRWYRPRFRVRSFEPKRE